MGLLKNIEWKDESRNTLLYKVDLKKDFISKGSALSVRDGQVAIFADKGKMADVFLPGFYKLNTDNIPLLTRLMSWQYGFESPFKSDVYFVSTKQFTNEKWGTSNSIIIRDADYGAVRVRGFGTYSFKVDDAFVFLSELSGSGSSFRTSEITDFLRSMVVSGVTDTIGESKIPVLDMAGNLMEFSKIVETSLAESFKNIGLKLTKFNFENLSMPENLEKALDESSSLSMLGKNMNTYVTKAQADALVGAAKNTGTAGTTMGAGMGLGMGASLGNLMGGLFGNFGNVANPSNGKAASNAAQNADQPKCSECGAATADAKFCPECGSPTGTVCPECNSPLKAGVKFCPECGASLVPKCPSCGKENTPGAKFCRECGKKM